MMEESMAFKRITVMDLYDIIRRWHHKHPLSHIAKDSGYDRKTLRKYIQRAKDKGLTLERPLPAKEQVMDLLQDAIPTTQRPAKAQALLEPFLEELRDLINNQTNPLKPKTAFEVLCERHNLNDKVSYSSFKRFTRAHQLTLSPEKSTCRLEVPPAKEVQIDYAKVGLLLDPATGRRRTVYAFLATLCYSRHKYVEFVFSQNQQSFVASHVKMFEYFGGVPERIVLDNLKNGVIKADLYDPRLNRTYQELAEHYDCFLDPCRVVRPKDKGKVERDVQTIREQFRKLATLYPDLEIGRANREIQIWCQQTYGQRKHGTTQLKPYPTFLECEHPALKSLPSEPFQLAQWKEATVHPDHYVQFNKKAYSVPHPYVGKKVWVRGTDKVVQIFYDHKLIKQHTVTSHYRHTDWNDFPKNVGAALDEGLPRHLQSRAAGIGPNFQQLVRQTLQPHAFVNLRKAQALLNLAQGWPPALVEKAAVYALKHHSSLTYKEFKHLLETFEKQNHQQTELPLSQQTLEFIRDINYFFQEP
jgi:transposase